VWQLSFSMAIEGCTVGNRRMYGWHVRKGQRDTSSEGWPVPEHMYHRFVSLWGLSSESPVYVTVARKYMVRARFITSNFLVSCLLRNMPLSIEVGCPLFVPGLL
jgi:hypothetical protein